MQIIKKNQSKKQRQFVGRWKKNWKAGGLGGLPYAVVEHIWWDPCRKMNNVIIVNWAGLRFCYQKKKSSNKSSCLDGIKLCHFLRVRKSTSRQTVAKPDTMKLYFMSHSRKNHTFHPEISRKRVFCYIKTCFNDHNTDQISHWFVHYTSSLYFKLLFGANIDVSCIYSFKPFTLECKLIKQYTHFYTFLIYFSTEKYNRILSIILMKNWYSESGYLKGTCCLSYVWCC